MHLENIIILQNDWPLTHGCKKSHFFTTLMKNYMIHQMQVTIEFFIAGFIAFMPI